ncbi:hypothetical protein JYU34_014143 [Plutella xylostella]|uniref:Uncharacterized protein n=1 Tax=Plutella xylostella TaxID=51655 RepID=A0ABQ7Q7N1_PLUXY|nr:hypothetical protein JYU34_014143 [Plutella xylostella]
MRSVSQRSWVGQSWSDLQEQASVAAATRIRAGTAGVHPWTGQVHPWTDQVPPWTARIKGLCGSASTSAY